MKNGLRISWNILLFGAMWLAGWQHETGIYIFYQARGQLGMLMNTTSFSEFEKSRNLTPREKENLALIAGLKKYSVDSLGYKPTDNFTCIYDQGASPVLWAITASEKYRISAYYWHFPIVGRVSYKGFFDKEKAQREKNRMIAAGYDVDLRSVSAWSTLGWFSDPVLSSMLRKPKGSLCDLIFHELFHATYYAKSSVDYNENLASFVAHKATLRYLAGDTAARREYEDAYNDNLLIQEHMGRQMKNLAAFYDSIAGFSDAQKMLLRLREFNRISRSVESIPVSDRKRLKGLQDHLATFKNAWFIDFEQYSGLQDSLENAFNKFYDGDIKRMVQSLK